MPRKVRHTLNTPLIASTYSTEALGTDLVGGGSVVTDAYVEKPLTPPPSMGSLRASLFGSLHPLRFDWRVPYDQWRITLEQASIKKPSQIIVKLMGQEISINPKATLLVIYSSKDLRDEAEEPREFFQNLASTKITEVRIRFAKGNTNFYWLNDGIWKEEKEGRQTLTILEDPTRFESETDKHEVIQFAEIHAPWERPSRIPEFPGILKQAQKENNLTIEQILYRISEYLGESFTWDQIKKDFNGTYKYVPMNRLRAYAQLFGIDIRLLIASSNARFEQYKPANWSAENYPIYIDSEEDHARIDYFAKFDPRHESLGWQIYAARKNPFSYFELGFDAWCKTHGIHIRDVHSLELNTAAPHPKTIQALARVLNKPLAIVASWACSTYFGSGAFAVDEINGIKRQEVLAEFGLKSVAELFTRVLPGQIFYPDITPRALDFSKILLHARQPKTPGHLLFAARHALHPLDTMTTFAENNYFHEKVLHDREMGYTGLSKDNLHFWIKIFQVANIPITLLGAFIDDPRLVEDSSAHILASHLDTTIKAVRDETTASHHALADIRIHSDGAHISYEALLTMGKELGIPIHHLTIKQHPELLEVFPELKSDPGSLIVPDFVRNVALKHFNMSEFLVDVLFKYKLTIKDLADALGVHGNVLRHYIFANAQCQNEKLLLQLADDYLAPQLQSHSTSYLKDIPPLSSDETKVWARKILYLHHNPELFQIFKIRASAENEPAIITAKDFLDDKKSGQMRRLGQSVHEDLIRALQARLKAIGAPIPTTLKDHAKYLAALSDGTLKEAKAIQYFSDSFPLSFDSILILKKILPEINVRAWYEHIHQGVLAYFFGYLSAGQIDYSLPEGWSSEDLQNKDRMKTLILEKRSELFSSGARAAQESGLNFMQYPSYLHADLMNSKHVQLDTMARLAEALQIPRRLVYWFFRREELEQIIQPSQNQTTTVIKTEKLVLNLETSMPTVEAPDPISPFQIQAGNPNLLGVAGIHTLPGNIIAGK